ncbi:MAG: polysaccharide deacetylase family protein [Legionella sp.]|uniref:polysaccharide deacetylase family protein n=1 Tax=Legionella sp. TaxID=459 RepID=UPI00284A81E1|nr:polysaccharide deacetylase family protein [Legionella sp.]
MRDLIGYGPDGFNFYWPNNAKVAINFVINYEEGSELSPVNGDMYAEMQGMDFPFAAKDEGMRNLSAESCYEYGSRVGLWRLLRLFDLYQIPLTFFITGQALLLNPLFALYLAHNNHEVAGHGWRWIDYARVPREVEKEHIVLCIETLEKLTGQKPNGWYTGRRSENTRDLLLEIGGFTYDSDSYADDLPYYHDQHLIIPYSLDCNDFKFTTNPGFVTPQAFYEQLVASFNYLYEEKRPVIMTIGLHPRLSGKPARCQAIKQFLDYLLQYEDIWITQRINIADYWLKEFPVG